LNMWKAWSLRYMDLAKNYRPSPLKFPGLLNSLVIKSSESATISTWTFTLVLGCTRVDPDERGELLDYRTVRTLVTIVKSGFWIY
jgi:hypothetical protein